MGSNCIVSFPLLRRRPERVSLKSTCSNPPRQFGNSNYGISRTFRVFLDLLTTKFWLDYSTKPMHFFGFFGLTGRAPAF